VNILFALLACTSPRTVDGACRDRVLGSRHADEDEVAFLHQANCYRRLADLGSMHFRGSLQEAASSHATYMAEAGVVTTTEVPSQPYFSGVTVLDRIAAAGLDLDAFAYGLWYGDSGIDTELSPAQVVDAFVVEPYLRQFILQPSQDNAGVAFEDGYLSLLGLYDNPPTESRKDPIVYPVDGQLEVPTHYSSLTQTRDQVPRGDDLGFPVTVTVGSQHAAEWTSDPNPFDLAAWDAVLTGPDGEVALHPLTASQTSRALPYTVAFFPAVPLEAGATYDFEATVSWLDESEVPVRVQFTTTD